MGDQKEIEDTTVKCSNCKKTLYKGELCSCQRINTPVWVKDIQKETNEANKRNRLIG